MEHTTLCSGCQALDQTCREHGYPSIVSFFWSNVVAIGLGENEASCAVRPTAYTVMLC